MVTEPYTQQINKYSQYFGKELTSMQKSKMSRVMAHEEIGLRPEEINAVRKKEIHVSLGLPLTLVGF